ncbi:hypothetical protein M0R45_021591 [Rubus argutus]|uniref:Uncharacterized protein n=1 Tax=Rubus argutus TaxID=59490 RepID=A0AAW1XE18_RUBAR
MTTMEVEIICRETIKPSAPTPPRHRRRNLSFLEQMNPRTYTPLVLSEIPLPPESVIEKGDCVSKRFVFDPPKLAALKAMVCDKVQNLTIVEIVTAFIHRCDISALKSNSGSLLNPKP